MECNTLPNLRPTRPTIRYFATHNDNSAVILWAMLRMLSDF